MKAAFLKAAFILALAMLANSAQAQIAKLRLFNGSSAPLQVLADDRKVLANLAPNASATITVIPFQWMSQGEKIYRYNTDPIQRLKRKGVTIVLQFGSDAKLYLLNDEAMAVEEPLKPQPKGFPVRPDRNLTFR